MWHQAFKVLLQEAGGAKGSVSLSEESEDRNTALHLAAFRGSVELVIYILQVRAGARLGHTHTPHTQQHRHRHTVRSYVSLCSPSGVWRTRLAWTTASPRPGPPTPQMFSAPPLECVKLGPYSLGIT